jgi:galactonate dehydratase
MKITDVTTHVVAPIGEQLVLGCHVSWLFVEIHTDEGVTGLGECTNWPRRGNTVIHAAVRAIADSLVGRDPAQIEAIWTEVFRNYTYLGNRGAITAALSAIDTALWDIKGKALGRPVYDLLGGPVHESIPLYTHVSAADADRRSAQVSELIADGYRAFKCDPFAEMAPRHTAYLGGEISKPGIRAAADWMSALRDAVGPDIELLVDFHGNYNVASALRCIRALAPFDITWFEEPLPPENVDGLAQVRAQTDEPLCVGERLHTRWDFLPILTRRLVNFIMPDVCWTGGISELKKIATMAEACGVPIAPHGTLGPVQTLAGAHVMAGTPNLYRLEFIGPSALPLYNSVLTTPLDIRDGHLHLADRPGIGAELDMEWVRAHSRPDFL